MIRVLFDFLYDHLDPICYFCIKGCHFQDGCNRSSRPEVRPATLLEKRQVFSCEFCEISKNTFFHRAPLVFVSTLSQEWLNKSIKTKTKPEYL